MIFCKIFNCKKLGYNRCCNSCNDKRCVNRCQNNPEACKKSYKKMPESMKFKKFNK